MLEMITIRNVTRTVMRMKTTRGLAMKHPIHLMATINSYEIELKRKEKIANNTYAFSFTRPSGFQYSAGQHARLTVLRASGNKKANLSRLLSFASAPYENDLSFAMRMSQSVFKQAFLEMQIGDKVLLQTRQMRHRQSFTWDAHLNLSQPAVFVIGGIGVTPAFSMIKDAVERQLPTPIYLFYSNRCPEDAAYLVDLERIARQYPGFRFIPTMTKPATSSRDWQGETGYISRDMLQAYVSHPNTASYYVAGKSTMVGAMKKMIRDLGVNKSNICVEDFAGKRIRRHGLAAKLKIIGLGLFFAAALVVHLTGVSMLHAAHHLSSFGSEGLYLMAGLFLAVFGIKIILSTRR